MNAIVLFQRDLRIIDHPALYHAVSEGWKILPVYVFSPSNFDDFKEGFPKMGLQKTKFLWESVLDLQGQLQELGGDLLLAKGPIKDTINGLIKMYAIEKVFCSKAATTEEQAQYQQLETLIDVQAFESHSLLFENDLPFPLFKLPKVFTPFRKKVESSLQVSAPLPAPSAISFIPFEKTSEDFTFVTKNIKSPDERTAFPFVGGSTAGLTRLQDYIWKTQNIRTYKETRNGLIGTAYSSKFSPYLAWGCLSPRTIYQEIQQHEQHYGANDSTYWLFFELLWRDYFYFDALKKGGKFFKVTKNYVGQPNKGFDMWRKGETKDNFVNAAIRELNATGYMSNRMRQNVASYLIHDLKSDWYLGARYFESLLIDYDPASNYGNWTYLAGVGNDPRNNRRFNTQKQAENYDPNGEYQTLWQ